MAIRIVGRFLINTGKVQEFEKLVAAAVAEVRSEGGVEEYSFYIKRNQCIVLETYRDSAALAAHVVGPVGTEVIPRMIDITRSGFAVFGEIDKIAEDIASQFDATVFPGPTYSL